MASIDIIEKLEVGFIEQVLFEENVGPSLESVSAVEGKAFI